MLKMTVHLAEFSAMMSKYNESMRYALDGIRQAQELGNREAKARLFFCMGENNWRLSLKIKHTIILTGLLSFCGAQRRSGNDAALLLLWSRNELFNE